MMTCPRSGGNGLTGNGGRIIAQACEESASTRTTPRTTRFILWFLHAAFMPSKAGGNCYGAIRTCASCEWLARSRCDSSRRIPRRHLRESQTLWQHAAYSLPPNGAETSGPKKDCPKFFRKTLRAALPWLFGVRRRCGAIDTLLNTRKAAPKAFGAALQKLALR